MPTRSETYVSDYGMYVGLGRATICGLASRRGDTLGLSGGDDGDGEGAKVQLRRVAARWKVVGGGNNFNLQQHNDEF